MTKANLFFETRR